MKNKKCLLTLLLGAYMGFSVFAATKPAPNQLANAKIQGGSTNKTAVHHVGDCYGGGVIFYVNNTPNAPVGQRGLIVATADVANSFSWDTNPAGQDVDKTQATLFCGAINSETIFSKIGPARAQAVSAARHYTDGTYRDWYLPSQNELSTVYFNALAKGSKFWSKCGGAAPSAATYWSSTQNSAINAWGVSFAGGVVVVAHKNNPFLVRPIRAF